jgi:hypothetical protein
MGKDEFLWIIVRVAWGSEDTSMYVSTCSKIWTFWALGKALSYFPGMGKVFRFQFKTFRIL